MKIIAMIGIGAISFLVLFILTFIMGFGTAKYTVFGETYSDSYTEKTFSAFKSFIVSCIELGAAAAVYFHLSVAVSPITVIGILTAITLPVELLIKFLIDKADQKSSSKKKEDEEFKVSTCILMTLNVLAVSVFIPLIFNTIGLIK
ncbi:MAG: hypothetical protein J6B08_07465 [Ruminiclostridium sp.]|nr:hypothetical protein [Ruminiclostridium sp.]